MKTHIKNFMTLTSSIALIALITVTMLSQICY